MPNEVYAMGIDIGGTFTDVVLMDSSGGLRIHKLLTTPSDPAVAVLQGAEEILRKTGADFTQLELLVHSTTLVTNALTEQRGARTGLIGTAGFRDILEMRREHRYDIYDLFLEWPAVLVPRELRVTIPERVLVDGTVDIEASTEDIDRALATLREHDVQAIAVSFLHAYRNPANEVKVAQRIRELAPNLPVSLSHEVAPIIGEYERTSTTVADAYVRPITDTYLTRMAEGLKDRGFSGHLLLMLSGGGAASVDSARKHPVRMVESGPAAGALAAGHYGEIIDADPLISFDMGGTTAKLCLIADHRPAIVNTLEVARTKRFQRGSGFPVVAPSVELVEIGAGGGSIARLDELGLLKVGPESASAEPGPICYGRGGTQPTVTDANVILGLLDPDYFLGGDLKLDVAAARDAYEELGKAAGMSGVDAAWGVHEVVNESMAQAARMHLQERNVDPSKLAMIAFGGAGPAHAAGIARLLGVRRLVFPIGAGATSALGCLIAPLSFQHVHSLVSVLDHTDWLAVNEVLREMEEAGYAALADAGVHRDAVTIERAADIRVYGQQHELTVRVPGGELWADSLIHLTQQFAELYRRTYQHYDDNFVLEVVNWKVTAMGPAREALLRAAGGATSGPTVKKRRAVFMPELRTYADVPVYDRYSLGEGDEISGPAIVEERETSVNLPSNCVAHVDKYGDLIVELG
ncbi:MAG TPA: hydantoinase/oxoprolinase family protein [Longimicrobiaceae bacterium]|nr:hydantoinase/oxoprolinase family protein [Longimicrobiaceae bacterium]